METIEVIMWTTAGMIVAGIILGGAYQFMSSYFYNSDVHHSLLESKKLMDAIDNSCVGSIGNSATLEVSYPLIAEKLYVTGDFEGKGNMLCMVISGEKETCEKTRYCTVSMDSVEFLKKSDIHYFLSRVNGKERSAKLLFNVKKTGNNEANVSWSFTYQ